MAAFPWPPSRTGCCPTCWLAHVAERGLVEHGWLTWPTTVVRRIARHLHRRPAALPAPPSFSRCPAVDQSSSKACRPRCRPKLDRLLKLPLIGGLVRRKIPQGPSDQCKLRYRRRRPTAGAAEWYDWPRRSWHDWRTSRLAPHHPRGKKGSTVGLRPGPAFDSCHPRMRPGVMRTGRADRPGRGRLAAHRRAKVEERARRLPAHYRSRRQGLVQVQQGQITSPPRPSRTSSHEPPSKPAAWSAPISASRWASPCCRRLGCPSWRPMTRPSTRPCSPTRQAPGRCELASSTRMSSLDCLVPIRTPCTVDNGFITPDLLVKRNRIGKRPTARTSRPGVAEKAGVARD